jgi:hypothetical protein
MNFEYTQKIKSDVRHKMIRQAINTLTIDRTKSACVDSDYVRNIYDYFIGLEEGKTYKETLKIDINYILEWERQRNIKIGNKKPEDLTVCYLCGPEPENDFKEFISLGVLPQNIWAFEMDNSTYLQALSSYDTSDFKQPKLLKMSIEKFFECTPKKFDIVYVDACGSLVSDKHALRCISSLFKYHRLSSLGILLTNFSEVDPSNVVERTIYLDMMSKYFLIKQQPNVYLTNQASPTFNEIDHKILEKLTSNFDYYYGEFITSIICDISSVCTPNVRFANSGYWKYFLDIISPVNAPLTIADVNSITNNSLLKFFQYNKLLESHGCRDASITKINKLSLEMIGISPQSIDLLKSMNIIQQIKNHGNLKAEIKSFVSFFDSCNMYPFLDDPNKNLFLDLTINQFSYPMHYATHKAKRLTYKAKETKMFMDLMVFDECRYIYEWLPSLHQIKNAFQNLSWQYVFRFAVDGLVKQRIRYNNEFFFQGSVISKEIYGFQEKQICEREILGG